MCAAKSHRKVSKVIARIVGIQEEIGQKHEARKQAGKEEETSKNIANMLQPRKQIESNQNTRKHTSNKATKRKG